MDTPATHNPLKIKRLHHVEFWVGNAKQAAFYYRKAFGFSQIAYRGLETGSREVTSYVMRQGDAYLVLTTPMSSEGPIAEHIKLHGDGVRDIAFEVEDTDSAYEEAIRRGAKSAGEPTWLADEHGRVRHAAIHTYGDTIHSFISREAPPSVSNGSGAVPPLVTGQQPQTSGSNGHHGYGGPFLPGFVAKEIPGISTGILRIDHMVGNVELGRMREWCDFYNQVLGFHQYITFDDKDISTEYSALMSIVMSDDNHVIKFPINEPAPGKRKSQIDEYLEFYNGAGVQHIALLTRDVLETVSALRENGVEFLRVPDTYYEQAKARVGEIKEPWDEVQNLNLLIDRDDEGYLLQLFSKPVEDRPTLFFEIIQRRGSRGFGKGNFRALFEAIEAEQALRGNL
jgi:4-hydroxyphenylpyruvate dioxygenase